MHQKEPIGSTTGIQAMPTAGLLEYSTIGLDNNFNTFFAADIKMLTSKTLKSRLKQLLKGSAHQWKFNITDPSSINQSFRLSGLSDGLYTSRTPPDWTKTRDYPNDVVSGEEGVLTFYLDHSPGKVEFGNVPSRETRMSAWMLLHRIGHSVVNSIKKENDEHLESIGKLIQSIHSEYQRVGETPSIDHGDYPVSLLRLVTTMRSSRENTSFSLNEIFHELVAQHISSGIKLCLPPDSVDLSKITYYRHPTLMHGVLERKNKLNQEKLDAHVTEISKVIEKALNNLSGKILYSYT